MEHDEAIHFNCIVGVVGSIKCERYGNATLEYLSEGDWERIQQLSFFYKSVRLVDAYVKRMFIMKGHNEKDLGVFSISYYCT